MKRIGPLYFQRDGRNVKVYKSWFRHTGEEEPSHTGVTFECADLRDIAALLIQVAEENGK